MWQPQVPLERDGSPVREFAFWLRDLRNRSGLTYEQVARSTHYGTSTLQAATSGERLPTLKVVMAFVKACDGDSVIWLDYWTQIKKLQDREAPHLSPWFTGPPWTVDPPWFAQFRRPAAASAPGLADTTASSEDADWYVESFDALLRLDVEPVEAIERRVITAARDFVRELSTSIRVPRDHAESAEAHALQVELLRGGQLALKEQPHENYDGNVIVLPRPLAAGERHEYALRIRLPAGQQMASHYVHVPFRRCDSFELRVRFNPAQLPAAIWPVDGAPITVIYEGRQLRDILVPDRFGEVCVQYHDLHVGLGYGICWLAAEPHEIEPEPVVTGRARKDPDSDRHFEAWLLSAPHLTEHEVSVCGVDPARSDLIRLPGPDQQQILPAFQFDDENLPRPIVTAINTLLNVDDDPWGVADWWLGKNAWLRGIPADLLGLIPDESLMRAAQAEVQEE